MFLGILLVSAFTGEVSSSITLAQLRASIGEIDDLARFRDGVMRGSLVESMLVESGIPAKTFESYEAGLQALEDGTITSFAGDSITLRYPARPSRKAESRHLRLSSRDLRNGDPPSVP
jgi:ABC-type amino acid transport substrate-binding protein